MTLLDAIDEREELTTLISELAVAVSVSVSVFISTDDDDIDDAVFAVMSIASLTVRSSASDAKGTFGMREEYAVREPARARMAMRTTRSFFMDNGEVRG